MSLFTLIAVGIGMFAPLYGLARSKPEQSVFSNCYIAFLLTGTTVVWIRVVVTEHMSIWDAVAMWPLIFLFALLSTLIPALCSYALFSFLCNRRQKR